MISSDRGIGGLLLVMTLLVIMGGSPAAFGQNPNGEELVDDGPVMPQVVIPGRVVRGAQVSPEQVDQWVFNRFGGADATRDRLDANLALRIDDIERACAVTDLQKKKLKLAGLGDIKRYFDRVNDLKRKYSTAASNSNNNFNNIWTEMQPLQLELNSGLFGDDSMFVKTIKSTLGSEQAQRYDDLMQERALERGRATIEWFVVHIDKALGLSDLQRGRLVELLEQETPPPQRFGQADFWYLMYQMTRLPEAKLKAILDEPQWRLLSRQFMQARGMEPWLKSNGLIAQNAEAAGRGRMQGAAPMGAPTVGPGRLTAPLSARRPLPEARRGRSDGMPAETASGGPRTFLMKRSNRRQFRNRAFLGLFMLLALACGALAQEPAREQRVIKAPGNDLIEVEEAPGNVDLQRLEQMNRELQALAYFRGDTKQVQGRLETRLKSRIDQIDRVCKLTPEQRGKLTVAGRGDIRRTFARFNEVKEKLSAAQQEAVGRRELLMFEFAKRSQAMTDIDCFGEGSLFSKVLKHMLTPEQLAVREKAARDASIAQHKSTIRWAIGSMDTWLQLSPSQHEKLEKLLLQKTRAPRKFGEYDYYGLMFQASKLSEGELKPIFDNDQWRRFERQLAEARRLEKMLRVEGFVPDDGVADAGNSRPKDPLSEPEGPQC